MTPPDSSPAKYRDWQARGALRRNRRDKSCCTAANPRAKRLTRPLGTGPRKGAQRSALSLPHP